jgi:hypothetical protein
MLKRHIKESPGLAGQDVNGHITPLSNVIAQRLGDPTTLTVSSAPP